MVLTPDKHLNLRADIKATLQSIEARLRAGGNWRGTARIARELATKLDKLADMDEAHDAGQQARIRYEDRESPAAERHARKFRTPPDPRYGKKKGPRTVITDITTRKELPPA